MVHRSARGRPAWGALRLWLSQLWWAGRLGVWLCGLPIRLRRHPLPALLHRLTPVRGRRECGRPLALPHATRVVVQVCRLQLFHLPIFPRACLRRALALSYVLTRCGYAVEIHFGVRKEGERLHGHSWVTLQGQPVAERARRDRFPIVYSYPSVARRSPREGTVPSHRAGSARRSSWRRRRHRRHPQGRRHQAPPARSRPAKRRGRSPS